MVFLYNIYLLYVYWDLLVIGWFDLLYIIINLLFMDNNKNEKSANAPNLVPPVDILSGDASNNNNNNNSNQGGHQRSQSKSNSNSNSNNNNSNSNNNNNSNKSKKRGKGEIDDIDINLNARDSDDEKNDTLADIGNFDWKSEVLVWKDGELVVNASLSRLTDLYLSGRLGRFGSTAASNALESLKSVIMSMAFGDSGMPAKKRRKRNHNNNSNSNKTVMFIYIFIYDIYFFLFVCLFRLRT